MKFNDKVSNPVITAVFSLLLYLLFIFLRPSYQSMQVGTPTLSLALFTVCEPSTEPGAGNRKGANKGRREKYIIIVYLILLLVFIFILICAYRCIQNQRRNIIWHFCRINAGRAPADGAESSLQMCPEATRLNSLFTQRAASERSKLSVCRYLFPKSVRQAV